MRHENPIIQAMFDSEQFASTGHALIEMLAKHLETNLSGTNKVLDWLDPTLESFQWQEPLPHSPIFDSKTLLTKLSNKILKNNLNIHHPHNLGHQVSTPLPLAALCDLVAALTNQAMAVYEAGPSATMLERQVIRWLSALIDEQSWNNAGGVLTSGGAQANLTALLVARQVTISQFDSAYDIWKNGMRSELKLCILASEHAHYSISRAAGIMGLGSASVIKVATNLQGQLDLNALIETHKACITNGAIVIAIVANAGCTPTGSIDPLLAIGEYCKDNKLWFHVDGAHGASSLLSSLHRDRLKGISLADSVVWDGHKLMYMPATISAVLFKEEQHSFRAFSQEASYLFQGESYQDETFNTSYRTLECTKRMMALKLWAAFSVYGIDGMGVLVDEAYAKAQLLAEKIKKQQKFELLMKPETNIVCFRYLSEGLKNVLLNEHQTNIRQHIVKSGAFHLTQVNLNGITWLRSTLMNPFTTAQDLDALLQTITAASQSCLAC